MFARICFFTLWLVPLCSWGHQQKEAYTTILLNERSGNLEVTHRVSLHDAEHALITLFKSKQDIYSDKRAQNQFALYIDYKFKLKNAVDEDIELNLLGFETEGLYIWVYQEYKLSDDIDRTFTEKVTVKMDALQEVWPDQVNHINVEKDGRTYSARLKKDDGWQSIQLL